MRGEYWINGKMRGCLTDRGKQERSYSMTEPSSSKIGGDRVGASNQFAKTAEIVQVNANTERNPEGHFVRINSRNCGSSTAVTEKWALRSVRLTAREIEPNTTRQCASAFRAASTLGGPFNNQCAKTIPPRSSSRWPCHFESSMAGGISHRERTLELFDTANHPNWPYAGCRLECIHLLQVGVNERYRSAEAVLRMDYYNLPTPEHRSAESVGADSTRLCPSEPRGASGAVREMSLMQVRAAQ